MSYDGGKLVERKGNLPVCCRLAGDFALALFLGAAFSVFVYRMNDGQFRWFIAASAACGFALWHKTASRVLLPLVSALAGLLRRAVEAVVVRPVCAAAKWIGRMIRAACGLMGRALRAVFAATAGRAVRGMKKWAGIRRTERERLKLAGSVQFQGEEMTRL